MEFLPLKKDGLKVYAGFWKRLWAVLIDALVLIPVTALMSFLERINIPFAITVSLFGLFFYTLYTVYFHYKYGATIGKMVVSIKVTQKNSSPISFKQAVYRSSVDFVFAIIRSYANIVAILRIDSSTYLNAGWLETVELLAPFYPSWNKYALVLMNIWMFSEIFVILFNKRRRALHDFIAGTVVIRKQFVEQIH